jgi:hypothetical protein
MWNEILISLRSHEKVFKFLYSTLSIHRVRIAIFTFAARLSASATMMTNLKLINKHSKIAYHFLLIVNWGTLRIVRINQLRHLMNISDI